MMKATHWLALACCLAGLSPMLALAQSSDVEVHLVGDAADEKLGATVADLLARSGRLPRVAQVPTFALSAIPEHPARDEVWVTVPSSGLAVIFFASKADRFAVRELPLSGAKLDVVARERIGQAVAASLEALTHADFAGAIDRPAFVA